MLAAPWAGEYLSMSMRFVPETPRSDRSDFELPVPELRVLPRREPWATQIERVVFGFACVMIAFYAGFAAGKKSDLRVAQLEGELSAAKAREDLHMDEIRRLVETSLESQAHSEYFASRDGFDEPAGFATSRTLPLHGRGPDPL